MNETNSLRDQMLDWWPVLMHYSGTLGLGWQILQVLLAGTADVKPSLLALFGGMVGLYKIVDAQQARNAKRGIE
jgi:TctA family transporter